jgi:hypothetical protein
MATKSRSKKSKTAARAAAKAAIKKKQTATSVQRIGAVKIAAGLVAQIIAALKSFGKVDYRATGTTVYANREVALNILPQHVRGATRRVDNNCPIARALLTSPLGQWITDAHVGNTTVRVWNAAVPDLEVKFLLSPELVYAIKAWDRPGGKWELDPGVYWLMAYPRSLRRIYIPREPRTYTKSGRRTRTAMRHITRLNDIRRAMALADVKRNGRTTKTKRVV